MIEAMVVVAIVGVAAGLGVASLRPAVTDVRLHGAARGAAALIRSARLQAVSRHQRVSVTRSGSSIVVSACPARFGDRKSGG
jgi:type II secretory pathway pseudopilin PulG